MNKAIFFEFTNFEWMSQDDDLENFRTTNWWKGIKTHYSEIQELLDQFWEFYYVEYEMSTEERIRFYSNLISALNELAPDISVLLIKPFSNLALTYYDLGNYADAIDYLLDIEAILVGVLGKEHPDYASLLLSLGALYESNTDYTKAEHYYLESLVITEHLLGKEHPDYIHSFKNLGFYYYRIGDYTKVEQYFLESLAIIERVLGKEHPDYIYSLVNLGFYYNEIGDYTKAKQYYHESITIIEFEFEKEHPEYASSLNNLGLIYRIMGDYANAEQYILESITIKEHVLGRDDPDYAVSLLNLGIFYYDIKDFTKAKQYYLESMDIYERVLEEKNLEYASLLNSLGTLHESMGDYSIAEQYLLEGKNIRERILGKEHPNYAGSLSNLGILYEKLKDYIKAEQYYLESMAIFERELGKENHYYTGSLNNLGILYRIMEDYSKAEQYHLEAIAIDELVMGKKHPKYYDTLENIYILYLDSQNYLYAFEYKQEANLLGETLLNQNFSFMSEQQREAYWSANSYSFELTYSLSHFYSISESDALSYDNALFTKGLLLRTTNAVRDSIYNSGDATLIAQFEELSRLRQQIGNLRQSGSDNETYIRELEQQADNLDKSLTQASAAFKEFQEDLALRWQNVRDSLQPGEAAIEFVSFKLYDKGWTDTTLYAALVLQHDTEAPVWVPLCDESELTGIFEKLAEQIEQVEHDEKPKEQARILYDEYGADVYAAVWQPLEKTLEGVKTVYYSPSGLLHKISFAAIPLGEEQRLKDIYDLNLVSTTREIIYRENRKAQKPDSAVVYGGLYYELNPDRMKQEALVYQDQGTRLRSAVATLSEKDTGGITWTYLSQSATEGYSIQRKLTENNVPVVLYNAARGNKESFINLDGKQTGIIHLATHGFFLENIERNYAEIERLERMGVGRRVFENPLMRSGLILAGGNNTWTGRPVEGVENGILFADDIARMNLLGTELVVLSACVTGLGDVKNGEGVFGLQRAFKLAGAKTLVMSFWEVDDRVSREMMEGFYENWLSGMSKQDAFKKAQDKVREQYPEPYYWAAFERVIINFL
jgi:CHAT domain-containing protein/Flp pilus assembly protein TadD